MFRRPRKRRPKRRFICRISGLELVQVPQTPLRPRKRIDAFVFFAKETQQKIFLFRVWELR
jgi:hypothetical protein